MTVELISIGDELLIGQTINTNAAWMGGELKKIGADVVYGTVIQDTEEAILNAVEVALSRVDVILITGGLGPTKDDITKKTLCKFFNCGMKRDTAVLEHVKSFFESRGRVMLDVNYLQADVPEVASVLFNENGTAPGMWFGVDGKVLVSMPGVPYEMKGIMTDEVLPRLKRQFNAKSLFYQTIQTQGIGESYLADRMPDLEEDMQSSGVKLAYLPSPGGVRLRLSSEDTPENVAKIEAYKKELKTRFPQYVFGEGEVSLESVVGELLTRNKETVGTVESITGGAIGAAIASVPGASGYFVGGLLTYSAELKRQLANVSFETIETYGLVSEEVAREMAIGGKKELHVDYCIGITGNAGPTTNDDKSNVGVVCVAIADNHGVISKKMRFENNRERNIKRSVLSALNILRCRIAKINIEKSS